MSKFPINFVPEKDLVAGFELLTPGECTFLVKNVYHEDKDGSPLRSGKGDPMAKVVLEVTDINGSISSIFEYFTPNTVFKAYNLCKAVGRKELYEADGVDLDLLKGLSGKCKVKTESSPGYNDRNNISSYIEHSKYKDPSKAGQEVYKAADVPDDALPF